MSLRVAHFVQRYPPALGGSEAYFARLSGWFAAGGHRVTVFTTTADALEAFWRAGAPCFPAQTSQVDGVEVRRYRLGLRFRGRRWLLKPLSWLPHRRWQGLTLTCNPLAWGMWREAARGNERFDLVHATAFPYAFPILCAQRLARRLGVPFFLTPFLHLGDLQNPRDPTRRGYTAPALMALVRAADVVFVQTPSEREALVQRGIAPDKLALQGLGVDPSACTGGQRVPARQAWRASSEEIVVGHLANNSAEKGTIDLLRAAELLWQEGHGFHLVLAGPEMPNFRRFWGTYRFAGRVRRLGVLTDQQKRDFFAGIDVFALPSRSDSFGLVLLEAWANGVANVAYRAGGIADVVRHEVDGLLAPCGDIPVLASQMHRLIQDSELRRRLAAAGHQRVHQEFRWQDKLALVRDHYLRAAKRP
jgi:glycosyltransferase involved in cell wall biosynthesis